MQQSKWKFYIQICKQQEETNALPGLGSRNHRTHSQWHSSPNKAILSNPFQVVPLPADQEIKYEPVGTILIQITTEVLEDIWEVFSNLEESFKV